MASIATDSAKLGPSEKFSPGSKFIGVVEYRADAKTMDITFKTGTKIRYLDVDRVTFLSFKQSPTFDSYYSRAIKGNLQSTKLVDQGIGRQKSAPLQTIKEDKDLNAGLKKQEARQEKIYGTVDRAFASIQ